MARAYKSRVVLNRKAFDAIDLGLVDGLFAVAQEILAAARVPDAPPMSKGLIEGGGAIGYLGRKKVASTQIGGRDVKKPRSLKLTPGESVVAVGFGFPGRFVELGTVDTPAQPFLTRAAAQVVPDARFIVGPKILKRLAGIRSYDGSGHRASRAAKAST
jgi:hypothetical protein